MSTSDDVEGDGAANGTTPGGRRRRGGHRAASRPAGPPADAAVAPPATPAAPPTAEPVSEPVLESAPEPTPEPTPEPAPPAEVEVTEPEDAGEPEPAVEPVAARQAVTLPVFQAASAAAAEPAPRRRRRAASRPAGPPVEPVAEPAAGPRSAAATRDPEQADEQVDEQADEQVVDAVDAPAAESETAAADDVQVTAVAETDADEAVDQAVDQEGDEDAAGDDESGEEPEDGARSRRGRRRRGGRGRRRRGGDDDAADDEDTTSEDGVVAESDDDAEDGADAPGDAEDAAVAESDADDADDADADEADESADPAEGDDEGGQASSRRRRRRRRRGGSGEGDDAGEPEPEAATASRRSRSRRSSSSSSRESSDSGDVTALKGSTRLEAKRQRRRDGRDGGRRPRVLSEAEFLARRESVERTMVVRVRDGRSQVAVLEDGVLVEHYAARKQQMSMIGNVHLGRVQNVLPSMEAAFVDIGRGRNAVLYAGEVDWDAAGLSGQQKKIESALKSGDPVLVQVSKDPIGHKGARLTSQVSLPGRYLVYVPSGTMTGISRKLPDTERSRLKSILKEVVPADAGVIVRTAAEGASEEELRRDVERLAAQWEEISTRAKQVSPPTLLHGEPDLVIKVVRDVFNEDFTRLVVEGDEAWDAIRPYVDAVAPDLAERVSRWEDDDAAGASGGAFAHHRVDEQIAKALERKVWLPSGGSLVIDRTEAMTVVDVNTGRFTGSGGNLEETVTRNNLEAAEEIVRQLRLRDIGGIVVVDFIDMVLESNRDLVLRRLVECLGRDRSKHQVAEVTSLGLVQMTRKRVGQGLLETFSEPCEHCAGRGVVVQDDLAVVPSGHQHGGQNGGQHGGQHSSQHGGQAGQQHGGPGRSGRGEQRSEPRGEPRQDRQPPRQDARPDHRPDHRPDQAAEQRADVAEPHAAAARSREEAARDAVREAMNGIAMATLRTPRPEHEAAPAPSLEAAALLAALGGAVDPEPAGAPRVTEVTEVTEVSEATSVTLVTEEAEADEIAEVAEVVAVDGVADARPQPLRSDEQHDGLPGERSDEDGE